MRIKTFQGRTLEEILPEIRKELGADAVVLGQSSKIVGGIGGFFGTKMIEVTAADRMPTDEELIEIEGERAKDSSSNTSGDRGAGMAGDTNEKNEQELELADRFRAAMSGKQAQGSIDLTDDWDPAQDEELASEYGRVLEHAAAADFAELELPVVNQALSAAEEASATMSAVAPNAADEMQHGAERAVRRAHERMSAAAERVSGAYAPPMALPQKPGYEAPTTTFNASVVTAPPNGIISNSVANPDQALAADLAFTQTVPAAQSITQASAPQVVLPAAPITVHAQQQSPAHAFSHQISVEQKWSDTARSWIDHLTSMGVDDDVARSILTTVVQHRSPFAVQARVEDLLREVLEETMSVRSGFHKVAGRAHRLALVGATNSGKSSVGAKLARTYASNGLHVGVIHIVSTSPDVPIMQDQHYLNAGIEVRYVTNLEQAQVAKETFADRDLIIIDTPGEAYLQNAVCSELTAYFSLLDVDDVHVVVPLSTNNREAVSLVDTFAPLGANRLIVSRLDESRFFGQILNFGFRLGLPMTFLSEGSGLNGQLKAASSRDLTERLLQTHQEMPANSENKDQ